MPKKLFLLQTTLFLLGFLFSIVGCDQRVDQKNVILISLDTLRADHLGCYGYEQQTSPNIDRLSQKGIRFSNAIAQSSWTLPSHMSFFTSRYPSFHKVMTTEHTLNPDIPTMAEIFKNNGYTTAAFTEGGNMFRIYGFGKGFDIYEEKSRNIDLSFAQAFRWLKQRKQGEKFLLFIHTYEIHTPYKRTELADQVKRGRLPEVLEVNDFLYDVMYGRYRLTDEEKDYIRGLYDSGIYNADRYIGNLISLLEELHLLNDTILLIFSDHGEDLWDHGVSPAHGLTLYRDQLHVPVILYDQRLSAPIEVEDQVELIDFMPTLFAMNGIPVPVDVQGENLLPVIKGELTTKKRVAFSEGTDYGPNRIAVIQDGYKYIFIPEPNIVKRNLSMNMLKKLEINLSRHALFDIQKDPQEKQNIYQENTAKAKSLQRLLDTTYIAPSRKIPEVNVQQALLADQMQRLQSLGYIE
jgi:arylsulfatase A-like enzyme